MPFLTYKTLNMPEQAAPAPPAPVYYPGFTVKSDIFGSRFYIPRIRGWGGGYDRSTQPRSFGSARALLLVLKRTVRRLAG